MLRFLVLSILLTIIVRSLARLADSFMQGYRGDAPPPNRSRTPQRSVHMERDPVCGTFVIPDRAVSMLDGRERVYFCSTACRDKYRARTA
ncbi:MAG TPA: hypothetical protein VFA59_26100 [Vicinamibacterales bacterium]|nr:hypothetical protein [Vicinamibacterales bacterium]